MQRLHLERGFFRTPDGRCVFLIGANFWPKARGPFMYRDPWNAAAVDADLAELAALGANCARIFCFLPDLMLAPDALNPGALSRLDTTIELAAQRGLWVMPTILVGHMSGENWSPPWASGRDWYTDEGLLEAQEGVTRTLAARYSGDPRIAAWIATNEWPLFAGTTSEARGLAWAKRIKAALRAGDAQAVVGLGDGAWDVAFGQVTGLNSWALRDVVDFFGPHVYPKERDALRHSLVASFAMRMLAPLGRPVLFEEFGCSSDQSDDDDAAAYYRTSLWSALGAGACGALAWNSHDFELSGRRPYSHHPYELHFGLLRADGTPKLQGEEFATFARFIRTHDFDDWEPLPPRAAIARTAFFQQQFPFDWGWTKPEMRDCYLQSYALCVRAGLDAGFVDLAPLPDEVDAPKAAPPAALDLILVPCIQQVTTRNAEQLEGFARAGGTVYASFGGEPWFPDLGRFIGAKPRIKYGLAEMPRAQAVAMRVVAEFGSLREGDQIEIRLRGDERRRAMLHCEPAGARVIAVDDAGHPALLLRQLDGGGRVIFATYPLEYYLMEGVEANVDDATWRFYHAIASTCGLLESAPKEPSSVQTFIMRSRAKPNLRRMIFVNHAWAPARVRLPGTTDERLDLPAKGTRVVDVNVPA